MNSPPDASRGRFCSTRLGDPARQREGLVIRIPGLVSYLSSIVTLLPGDLIFTGTPAGLGMGRDPQVWLKPGDELVTWVEGIGQLRQSFVA